ncbi:MAG: DUF4270 family protein [Deltaproteobacteria bacterium]
MKKFFYFFLLFIFIINQGCIKSTIIGDDILAGDEIGVDFSDVINITATTLKNDSFEVFPNSRNPFILGRFENPVIGVATAALAMDFEIKSDIPDTIKLSSLIIDSLVLTVNVDTSYNYGDSLATHSISVFELDQNIQLKSSDTVKYYSNYKFNYKPAPIGQINIVPAYIDSVRVIEPKKDTVKYSQMFRIQLDKALAQKIMQDTSILGNSEKFKSVFKGIYVLSTASSGSMIGIGKTNATGSISTKIELYYSVNDVPSKLIFPVKYIVPNFIHDYSGSEMKNFFGSSALSDSLMFIQGMTGSKLRIQLSGLDTLSAKNINKAELILYTADYDKKSELPFRLIAFIEDQDGKLTQIEDYIYAENFGEPLYYNGYAYDFDENGIKGKKYRIGLTTHIKKLIKNGKYTTKLIILPSDRIGQPGFAKFFGPGNTKLRTKLNVVFSEKN